MIAIVFSYEVRAVAEFEQAYGAEGEWARFFKQGPGYIGTEMVRAMPEDVLAKIIATIPVGRLGTPEDIARAVVFLTADEAGYITGADLTINGGSYFH